MGREWRRKIVKKSRQEKTEVPSEACVCVYERTGRSHRWKYGHVRYAIGNRFKMFKV